MRKLRVIVCGVGFGRYYIEAILRLPDLFELVGILSRGSKNSIKLAEKYGVPLMTDIEEISKENVDAVCVVVTGISHVIIETSTQKNFEFK